MSEENASAASFLRMASEDSSIREALNELIAQSKGVEQSVLEASVELARERGVDLTVEELRGEVERQLGLVDIELSGEIEAASACKSRSGCRTPCVYCKQLEE
ncbi:Nif11-like leader peptide family natural product precursor [Streptomyces sp. bgisy084]|uniref:Nif11-like leader peptide family natural product precursor n=1 Tax=unclassified Streptomyces TaxID=2593676 RepID=UPI003D711183